MKVLFIVVGIILLLIGVILEAKLLWYDYPDLTQRRIWIENTGSMLLYASLALVGYIMMRVGLELKR